MDDNNIVKPDTAEWTEEVIAEGKQIRPPMLAIPFKTIVEHFQNIIGPLIHEKITRHPGANTQETVSAILPPGFHQYLFFNFAGETNDRKTIIEYLGDYSTKLFAAGSFAIIWKLTTEQSDQKTNIGFEYGVFNSKFVLQAPRGLSLSRSQRDRQIDEAMESRLLTDIARRNSQQKSEPNAILALHQTLAGPFLVIEDLD
jgi:hypothetical protein